MNNKRITRSKSKNERGLESDIESNSFQARNRLLRNPVRASTSAQRKTSTPEVASAVIEKPKLNLVREERFSDSESISSKSFLEEIKNDLKQKLNKLIIDSAIIKSEIENISGILSDIPSKGEAKTLSSFSIEPSREKMAHNNDLSGQNQVKLHANQVISLRDAAEAVPLYDGTGSLSQFLEGCADACNMVDEEAVGNLLKLLRNKLKGEAYESVKGKQFKTLDEFKTHLKEIYAPTQTVFYWFGVLAQQFQKNNEKVLTFANRMREIGNNILEAQEIEKGTVASDFKTELQNQIFKYFKKGLKPEILQKLPADITAANSLQKAILAEKEIEADRILRSGSCYQVKNNERKFVNTTEIESCSHCKGLNHTIENCWKLHGKPTRNKVTCQICDRDNHTAKDCYKLKKCTFCNIQGHSEDRCSAKKNQLKTKIVCQLCSEPNHTAKNCGKNNIQCQLCSNFGHSARDCKRNPVDSSSNKQTPVVCYRCRGIGHYASKCTSNKIYEQSTSGNGINPSMQSANQGISANHTRSQEQEMNALLCDLLPLGLQDHTN